MTPPKHLTDADARRTAQDALREAVLARQAIQAHERHCIERAEEVAETLTRVGQDVRDYLAQSRDARRRLHARVDQTNDRIAENHAVVSAGFENLRSGIIRALSALTLTLAGALGTVLWYLVTRGNG